MGDPPEEGRLIDQTVRFFAGRMRRVEQALMLSLGFVKVKTFDGQRCR
jgi:hypothetical protein